MTFVGANIGVRQYYIAPTGNDSNDGSATHPWATIGHGGNGDRSGCHCPCGSRSIYRYIDTRASGRRWPGITYISDVQWGAKIIGNQVDHSTWHNYGNYVDIAGFELTSVGVSDCTMTAHLCATGNHVHDIAGPLPQCATWVELEFMHGNYSATRDEMIGNVVMTLV